MQVLETNQQAELEYVQIDLDEARYEALSFKQ